RARRLKVPVGVFDRSTFYETDEVLEMLKAEADFVILAGFLWKVPEKILRAFPNKIINIHPALLPKYGGKGMYGHHVHQAVIDHKEPVSGITIHFVNEHYDEGAIVFQQTVAVAPTDTPESLAQKIHKLEHTHFPAVIEAILSDNSTHG
ncbi:MAG: formyltransferase family protein, partial [Lutibacter sp.]|nr:formyltransferase family protein [Lutibacter sp.]